MDTLKSCNDVLAKAFKQCITIVQMRSDKTTNHSLKSKIKETKDLILEISLKWKKT